MDAEKIKLRTLANLPVIYKKVAIKPKPLNEIIELGYEEYIRKLNIISLTVEDIIEGIDIDITMKLSMLEFFMHSGDSDSLVEYLNTVSYFIESEVGLTPQMNELIISNELYSFEDLEAIIKIIKIQNCVVTERDDDFKPLNENARKLREKMLERQRKLRKLKSDNEENSLRFLDLISILCSNANGISIHNVFELNFFQFSDQFNRMKMIDEYEVNIQALLHGADSKNIKLKHWISKSE